MHQFKVGSLVMIWKKKKKKKNGGVQEMQNLDLKRGRAV